MADQNLTNVPGTPGVELGRQGRMVAVVDHARTLDFWIGQKFDRRPATIPEGWVEQAGLWLQVAPSSHADAPDILTVWFDTMDHTEGTACMYYDRTEARTALEAQDPTPSTTRGPVRAEPQ